MSVLVFAENWDGSFKKASFEAVSYAKAVADKIGGSVTALVIGDVANAADLGKYGADKIITCAASSNSVDVYANIISAAADANGATAIVISASNNGRAIAPMVAVKSGAGLVSNVVEAPSNAAPLTVQKKVFSGKGFATVEVKEAKAVLTVAANAFGVHENAGAGAVESASFDGGSALTSSASIDKATGKLSLAEAELVVSAGRGLKGPENWAMVEELADLLGAATACSKPVADIGWRPHHEHVGQTGKAIAPNLYIAIGISGAIQHLAGVNSSKTIVAINIDPEAPFFKAADYGIVGDAFDVVPKLVEAVKAFKANA